MQRKTGNDSQKKGIRAVAEAITAITIITGRPVKRSR